MSVIVLLLSVSFSIALLFLVLFIWNVKKGQYEDPKGPSIRMLFDEKDEKDKEP